MADFTADFELGTNGATIATTDPGSATAWDVVVNDPKYDNTHAAHGSLGCKFTNGDTGVLEWTLPTPTEHYGRFYVYIPGDPSNYPRTMKIRQSGAMVAEILFWGVLILEDSGEVHNVSGSTAMTKGSWIRIEWHVIHSETVGQVTAKLFNTPNSTSPDDTVTSPANWNTGTAGDDIQIGDVGGTMGQDWWIDDVVANATSWPGPVPGSPALQTFKRFYGPAQLGSSAADLYTVPAATVARVMGIHASNPSGSPVDLTLSIGADGAATRVYDGYSLGADGVLDDHSPYELAAGEKIQGFASSAATVNLTITGWEKPA